MSKLIKFSLVAVLSLGLMPNTSFAQEADDEVEEVIVTGSKIKKSAVSYTHLTLPTIYSV